MDNLGNRESLVLRGATIPTDYGVNPNNNRYTQVGNAYPDYDDAGNMTQDEKGYQFVYDYENRIVEVYDPASVLVAEFDYDALGRRIRKTDYVDSTQSRTYVYET